MVAGSKIDNSDGGVLVERDGAVMRLVLDRPKRQNALTTSMIDTITEAVAEASVDDRTRVVVLCSSGANFCAGIDLVEANRPDRGHPTRAEGDSKPVKPRAGHLQRGFPHGPHRMIEVLAHAQLPVVSVVRGWAVGIGNMLALGADVVLADPSANFWAPFVPRGFTPDSGTSWLLPRLVGLRRAKEMVLKGTPIDGRRAAEWGLISECVPEDQLDEAARRVVEELAQAATVSYGLAKVLMGANLDVPLSAALQNEGVYEELAIRSDDFKEGIRAFSTKRSPDYTGR